MVSFREKNKYLICLATASGLYMPSIEKFIKNKFVTSFLKFMSLIATILVILRFSANFKRFVGSSGDLADRVFTLCLIINSIIPLLYLIYFNTNRQSFENLFNMWDASFQSKLFLEERLRTISDRKKKTDKLGTIAYLNVLCGGAVWILSEYFNKDKKLTHPTGWEYRHESPDYEIYVTYELVELSYECACTVAFDWLFMALLTTEDIQLQHLKRSLKLIIGHARINTSSVDECQIPTDPWTWEKNGYGKHKKLTEQELAESMDMKNSIRIWAKQHQDTIRIHQELAKVYYIPLCVQFFSLVLSLCVSGFTRVVLFRSNQETVLSILFYCGKCAIFYYNCTLGDKIKLASASIFEDAFDQNWYIYPKEVQKLFYIITMTSQKPLQIVAFRVYPLGAESFLKVFNFGYSFFMFLWQTTAKP